MHITKEQIDDLNVVVKVVIHKEDYQDKVEKILKDYRKQANIPGFRRGQVPLGLIKKQYGKAVLIDEVNKLLQDNLYKYLTEEKLDVLGYPLPKDQEDIDWDGDVFDFEFELGLVPSFEVSLKTKKAVTHYKIVADKKMINEGIEGIQRQHGTLTAKEEVGKSDEVTGTFTHEAEAIDHKTTIEISTLHKKAVNALVGKKVGELVTLNTKTLFKEDHLLPSALGVSKESAEQLDVTVSFTIEEINTRQPADLNQELFDKLYEKDQVSSEKELRNRIKEEYEDQFKRLSDQKLLDDFTEKLVKETTFDLPSAFLQKLMQRSDENHLSEEEAKEAFEESEKALRYQLIEGKIIKNNELQIQSDEMKAFAKDFVKAQMAQFGHFNPDEEMLDNIVSGVLENKNEVENLSEKLMSQKLLTLYKEKGNLKTKEITYENFIKEAYR